MPKLWTQTSLQVQARTAGIESKRAEGTRRLRRVTGSQGLEKLLRSKNVSPKFIKEGFLT